MAIFTLLGLSEGETMSERLGCSQEKGENKSEKRFLSSKVASEKECEGS